MNIQAIGIVSKTFLSFDEETTHIKVRWSEEISDTISVSLPTRKCEMIKRGQYVLVRGTGRIMRWTTESGKTAGQITLTDPLVFLLPSLVAENWKTVIELTAVNDRRRKLTVKLPGIEGEANETFKLGVKCHAEGVFIVEDERCVLIEYTSMGPRSINIYLSGDSTLPNSGDGGIVEGRPSVRIWRSGTSWSISAATVVVL